VSSDETGAIRYLVNPPEISAIDKYVLSPVQQFIVVSVDASFTFANGIMSE